MKTILITLLVLCGTASADTKKIEKLFKKAKVQGTLVVRAPDGTETVVNAKLADTALPPMSTFKIPNTIIGLETGVITDEKFALKWDGKKTRREAWNQDHDLPSALPRIPRGDDGAARRRPGRPALRL